MAEQSEHLGEKTSSLFLVNYPFQGLLKWQEKLSSKVQKSHIGLWSCNSSASVISFNPAWAKLSLFQSLPANTQSRPPSLPDACFAPFSSFINHNKCPDNVTEGTFRFPLSFSTLIYFACGGCNCGFPAGQIHVRGPQTTQTRFIQNRVALVQLKERFDSRVTFERRHLVVPRRKCNLSI